jgi:hypothetical protein
VARAAISNSSATNFQVQSHKRRRTGTRAYVWPIGQEPAACHATHGTGSRWPHRVWGFQFWPCCNIVHAWCRSNPYAQLNISASYQLDDPDSQGEWSLHLNWIFFLFPRSSEVLMEKSARMWLSGFTNGLHWDFFFSWSPVWKPSDSKDVTLCWRYYYSHQPEPNPVLDWLGVGSLGLGALTLIPKAGRTFRDW